MEQSYHKEVSIDDLMTIKTTKTAQEKFNWWLNTYFLNRGGILFYRFQVLSPLLWGGELCYGGLPKPKQMLAWMVQQGCSNYWQEGPPEERKDGMYSYNWDHDIHRRTMCSHLQTLEHLKVIKHRDKYLSLDYLCNDKLVVKEAKGMPLFLVKDSVHGIYYPPGSKKDVLLKRVTDEIALLNILMNSLNTP